MKVEFVYKIFPIFYFEYSGLRNKCVTSYGPFIVSEEYGRYNSTCASRKRLHREYAKQFWRTLCFRPILCLSTSTSIKLDVETHARHLLDYTGFSPKEFDKELSNKAKLIWSLSANRTVTEEEIKVAIRDRFNTLTQENKNESKTD
jgi:hypothetical protein